MKKTESKLQPMLRSGINILCLAAFFVASCGATGTGPQDSTEPKPGGSDARSDAKNELTYKPFTWISDSDWVHPSGAKLQRSLGVKVDIPATNVVAHNFVKGSGDTLYLELIANNAASAYRPANAQTIRTGTKTLQLTASDLMKDDAVELLNAPGDLPVLVFLMVNESADPSYVRIGRKLKGKGWVTRNF